MKTIFLSLISSVILLIGCGQKENKPATTSPDKPKQSKAIGVDGIIAKEEASTTTISTTGSIIANEEVEIKSEVAGKIRKIYFREGGTVSKGQLLVKLNDDDLVAQMKKMEIEIQLQELKENRQKQLLAAAAISQEEYDIALSNVKLLKANVDILRADIDKTNIVSPFNGVVGLKNISEGAIISTPTVIATIQNIHPLKLEFSIPEKYNNLVAVGSKVNFDVAGTSSGMMATVYAKEPKIDPATRTSKVRATFDNKTGKIFPGAFADITIPIGKKTNVIMIPSMAYIPDINGAKVFVSKGGVAMTVPVVAGLRTESEVQILEGLTPGDTVLTTGILQLKPKMAVEVTITNAAE